MYGLEIISGESPLRNVHIEDEVIVIGSLSQCDIQLEGEDIADKHLALEVKQGKMRIYDLVKSERLLLNGVVTREADIKHGDIIELGAYRLRILLDQGGDTVPMPPVDEHRPMSSMHLASLGAVGLMLTLQLIFIFFVSMRWRNSEIKKEVVPQIHLAHSVPTAKPAPKPAAPPPEKPKPAKAKPVTTPSKEIKPPPPKPAAPKPAVPKSKPVVPKPVVPKSKPAVPKPAVPEPKPVVPKPVAPKPAPAPPVVSKPEPFQPQERKPAAATPRKPAVKTPAPAVPKPAAPKPEIRKPAATKPRESVATVPVIPSPKPSAPSAPVSPAITPARPTIPVPAPTRPAADPLALEKIMLAEARGMMQKRDWLGADRVLERLQIINPKYMDAYVARARLFEARRKLPEAVSQWEAIIARGPRYAGFNEAVRSRERLTGLIKQASGQPPLAKRTEPVAPSERKIGIGAVEIQRYDKNERFDEMRLLTIILQPRSASQRLAGADITVEVSFFDEDVRSGRIAPTRALVPESLFQLSGRIRLSEPPNLNAAYVVPKGFRKKQQETSNREMRFYGYRIQVFHKGILQHQVAKPASLLSAEL